MMKLKCTVASGELLVLGLSHANLDKLRADGLAGAIRINGKELGLGCDIWITAAETEAVMLEAFKDGIGEGTKLHIDKRLKS